MKAILIAALGLAVVLPVQASASVLDPEVIIYRFPGVKDDGGATGVGVATVFHCTNFSGGQEGIRFVTRGISGALLTNLDTRISHLETLTASTHRVNAYHLTGTLDTGSVSQGTTAIAATSINIICTAETIDASAATPIGVARRGIRFSPVPGSQE
jgi:hypothetical protein